MYNLRKLLLQLPSGDMGNKQAPQSQSEEEEDRVTAGTAAAPTAAVPGTSRGAISNYPPQENGEDGEEELPPLPPPMKPITEPMLVATSSAASSADESQGKRVRAEHCLTIVPERTFCLLQVKKFCVLRVSIISKLRTN